MFNSLLEVLQGRLGHAKRKKSYDFFYCLPLCLTKGEPSGMIRSNTSFNLLCFRLFVSVLCLVVQSRPTLSTPWTVAHQAPLSMGFSRQEYWSGLPCPPPGYLPNPGIQPRSPALQADSLPPEPPGKRVDCCFYIISTATTTIQTSLGTKSSILLSQAVLLLLLLLK